MCKLPKEAFMSRLILHAAAALVTCSAGLSAAHLWHSPRPPRAPKAPPAALSEPVAAARAAERLAEQEIREIIRQYDIAQTRHDVGFFEKTEADSFLLTYADGATQTRSQAIASMLSWDKDIEYTSDDLRVQLYGDAVAVVTGRMTATRAGRESEYGQQWRWIDLFVRRDGRWQIISTAQID
jgi:hypothetical protein